MIQKHEHIVKFNSDERLVSIYRLYEDGKTVFLTEKIIPSITEMQCDLKKMAIEIGESLILDSEEGRKIFNLE